VEFSFFRLDCSLDQSGTVDVQTASWSQGVTRQNCSAKLAELETMSGPHLRQLWSELAKNPRISGLRRELMIPLLAYNIQERIYGGLPPKVARELRKIGESLRSGSKIPTPAHNRFQPGTRLIRQWGGETHEVILHSDGYEYRGEPFSNLSEIAHKITRVRRSGPTFFGTKIATPRKAKP
jgi:hypothetical protein